MFDLISVVFIVGFFALCVAYVHACDWILGHEDAPAETGSAEPLESGDEAVAA